MAKKKHKNEPQKNKRPLQPKHFLPVFAAIFIYLMFNVYTYMTTERVQPYEVTEGSIVNDRSYTGIILRSEQTEYADTTGDVNYYVREGKRASVGTRICSIDETGTLAEIMEAAGMTSVQLSSDDLIDVKKQLSAYSISYDDEQFDTVYDTKNSIHALMMEYANFNALTSQEEVLAQLGSSFSQIRTPVSGVISYAVDSYESLDESQITADIFDQTKYSHTVTRAGKSVNQGDPVYKVITDDNWSVIFPLNNEDLEAFTDKTSLQVVFDGNKLSTTGRFSRIPGADGRTYGKLEFSKYMVQFVSDRFVDFEVITNTAEGLKIPVSSVTQKKFYLVPLEFMGKGGDSNEDGFLKEVYSEAGTSVVFVPATVYYSTEEYYYLDASGKEEIKAGDYLVKPDSSERYQVGAVGNLNGVYNINKGYTVFKQIEILAENGEFYTVKKGTRYGLNVYDHILLDVAVLTDPDNGGSADSGDKEGVLIYQ